MIKFQFESEIALMSILKNKEILSEIVKISYSKKEILEKIGLSNNGKNYKTLEYYLKLHNISTDNLVKGNNLKGKVGRNNKIKIEDIFVSNCKYTIKSLKIKQYLIEYYNYDNKCNICGISDIWNGKKLVLQLDHINGINNDNKIENLRLLCPNCHSQTKTFAGKNITRNNQR